MTQLRATPRTRTPSPRCHRLCPPNDLREDQRMLLLVYSPHTADLVEPAAAQVTTKTL